MRLSTVCTVRDRYREPNSEVDGQRKLCPNRLALYTRFLRVGVNAVNAGVDCIIDHFYPNEWRGGPVTTVVYSLAYYCLGVWAIQDLWMESFANCGCLTQLLRVVELIPWGYSREGEEHSNESWDKIHGVLRYLLLDRSFGAYDERIQGYSYKGLVAWARLVMDYDEYTLGFLDAGIHEAAERSLGWTEHLWRRYLLGRNYLKRWDPYYEDYFAENRWSCSQWENMDHSNDHERYESDSNARSTTESEIREELLGNRRFGRSPFQAHLLLEVGSFQLNLLDDYLVEVSKGREFHRDDTDRPKYCMSA